MGILFVMAAYLPKTDVQIKDLTAARLKLT
jgi:hypothetical protein